MTTSHRSESSASASPDRAIIVERQNSGAWSAALVDAASGASIYRIDLEDGPGRSDTPDELFARAEALVLKIGPVGGVIFLAENIGATSPFEPKLVAGYPLPVWIVHPSVALARTLAPQHARFMVLDLGGDGSATMFKREAGGKFSDLIEFDGDLRGLLSHKPRRHAEHADLFADIVNEAAPSDSNSKNGTSGFSGRTTSAQLEARFSEVLRDLKPMFGVLPSFGCDAVVCVSPLFTLEPIAAAFESVTSTMGAGRRLSCILATGEERYQGALQCVRTAVRQPGVWLAGTVDRPAFSLVTERLVSYEVRHVARHIFDSDDATLASLLKDRPTLAVVDRAVVDHYGVAMASYASRHINLVGTVTVDATEAAKTWTLVERICDDGVRFGLGRDGIILAVGGGITLDVAGMAASIFRRGIRYVRVPTTLVGMIDAGVGIKQGVNFASKKNFLGSFYPPIGCVSDPSFLRSLPRRHIACGVAEMIKIALVCERRLFELLEANIAELLASHFQEPAQAADECILRAQLSMMQQLQPNLFEEDLRRWVDFGHTFSPAIEVASNHELAHGEAVALDIALATAIAVQRGRCDVSVLRRIIDLYRAAELPTSDVLCSSGVLAASLREVRLHRGGDLNMVVPTDIGSGAFLQDVDPVEIDAASRLVTEMQPAFTVT